MPAGQPSATAGTSTAGDPVSLRSHGYLLLSKSGIRAAGTVEIRLDTEHLYSFVSQLERPGLVDSLTKAISPKAQRQLTALVMRNTLMRCILI